MSFRVYQAQISTGAEKAAFYPVYQPHGQASQMAFLKVECDSNQEHLSRSHA
jgi:hypothetical protein